MPASKAHQMRTRARASAVLPSAAAALRFLGVPPAEADAIARRPLPEIDLPAGLF
ncbi:MAG: hypothetical protein Q8R92_13440 [Deltaproteobacteria bacterium]|nr:hypothetical protein [Deltaproteobacteria bacterium]